MTCWIRIVKSVKLMHHDDDDEVDKISKVGESVLQRVRQMNEDKLLCNLVAATALCIPIACTTTENNIYHTTELVN